MKRKKRYKHATIGKKKYYFYKIVWLDPCGDAGHAEIEEMKKLNIIIICNMENKATPVICFVANFAYTGYRDFKQKQRRLDYVWYLWNS